MDIAVFVDRDGVITDLGRYNQESDLAFLNHKEDIVFFGNTAEAIRLLNDNSIKVIMVTNQPQIAKGLITEQESMAINQEIVSQLKEKGAVIDAVYSCPHHPKGIIEQYAINCQCRKPLPGMLLQASRERAIDLRNSYMIGDRISDIKAGELAGCKTIGVRTGYACNDGFHDAVPNEMADDFYEAVKLIIRKKQQIKLFINAGGKGERFYPLTKDIPKPLFQVKGKPIIHHLVDWAKKYNISEIIMMNGYKAEKIIEYFGKGENFGIPIKHSNEPFPLGSGGPLKFAENNIDNTFAYISGDLICDVNLTKMIEFHRKNKADATIFLHKSLHPQDSDILKVDETGKIIKFISKHADHTDAGDLGNAGLVIMEPRVLNFIDSEIFNFENDLYPKLLEKNLKVMGYVSEELIFDIGTLERLKMAEGFNFEHSIQNEKLYSNSFEKQTEHLKEKKLNILVTGAGGMMGSHMLDFLTAKGHNVLGIDFVPTTDVRELNKSAEYVECDIRDRNKLTNLLAKLKPNIIFHLAAQSFPTVSWERPEYTIEANILGTINLFEAVKELKSDTIILNAGSSAEYGFVEAKDVPVKEDRELKPLHPYGVSKVAQELLAYQYYKNFGIKSVTIRIFNTTGAKKINDVCSDFTKQIALMEKGLQEPTLKVGNINTKRTITDVRDMIEAFWLAVHKCDMGERYNVSGEKVYQIKEIIETLRSLTNINFSLYQEPSLMRTTDELVIYGDSTRFKEKTGWSQKIELKTTLTDMLNYWRGKL